MFDDICLALFSGFLSSFLLLYIISKIINDGKVKINKNFFYSLGLIVLISIPLYIIIKSFIRIAFVYCLVVLIVLYFFKKPLKKVITSVFLGYIIITITEISVVLFSALLMKLLNFGIGEVLLNAYLNILILIIGTMIINNKKVLSLSLKIVNQAEKIPIPQALLIGVVGVIFIGSFMYYSYLSMPLPYLLILTFAIVSLYLFVTYQYTKEINEKELLQKEYEVLGKTLNDYETMYEHQRIVNHENKNQLLIIRSLAKKENKELISYIDELTNLKIKDSEELMNLLKKVPYGGFRGLLYSKFIQMQQDKITYNFSVNSKVKITDFKGIDESTNNLLYKVLGIILDNAIDATNLTSNKSISVLIYKDKEDLIISVANTYKQKIELEKMYTKGYTTKGGNHGYGLAIVKEIIDENAQLENQIKIAGNMFTQIIRIKNM